jgi:hypothetical protein
MQLTRPRIVRLIASKMGYELKIIRKEQSNYLSHIKSFFFEYSI